MEMRREAGARQSPGNRSKVKSQTYPKNCAPAGPTSTNRLASPSPSTIGGGVANLCLLTNRQVIRVGAVHFLGGIIMRIPLWRLPLMDPPLASTMKLTRKLEEVEGGEGWHRPVSKGLERGHASENGGENTSHAVTRTHSHSPMHRKGWGRECEKEYVVWSYLCWLFVHSLRWQVGNMSKVHLVRSLNHRSSKRNKLEYILSPFYYRQDNYQHRPLQGSRSIKRVCVLMIFM